MVEYSVKLSVYYRAGEIVYPVEESTGLCIRDGMGFHEMTRFIGDVKEIWTNAMIAVDSGLAFNLEIYMIDCDDSKGFRRWVSNGYDVKGIYMVEDDDYGDGTTFVDMYLTRDIVKELGDVLDW